MSRRSQKEVAKQRRQKAQKNKQYFFAAGGLIVVAIIGLLVFNYIRESGKPGERFEDEGHEHIDTEPESYIWKTRPPTSGPHAPYIDAWGVKTEPVPDWIQIHNLEDGGVIFHYNCPEGCEEEVAEVEEIMRGFDESMEYMILEPYPNMEHKFAMTAWTRMLVLDDIDREQIEDFIDVYRGVDNHE